MDVSAGRLAHGGAMDDAKRAYFFLRVAAGEAQWLESCEILGTRCVGLDVAPSDDGAEAERTSRGH